tara:strand:+ start:2225 stop:3703 length:1479 start_codon:yes stop_codon:yes gene_type:complete
MRDLKKYYRIIWKNLQKKKVFYKYFEKKHLYKDSSIATQKLLQFLKKNKISKKVILTFSNKSFEMYSSIYPILISGNIWVPLSINLPLEKIKNVVEQTQPFICFYDHQDKKIIDYLKQKVPCLRFKNILAKKYKKIISIKNEIDKLDIKSTAFIYFTSGSTGKPKGIKVSHKNIISDIFSQKKNIYKNNVKNLVFADYYDTAFSIFFDIFFPAIYFGSTIVPSLSRADNFYLLDHYHKNKINTLVAVPSTFNRIKETLIRENKILSGKTLILTGEPFYLNLLKFLYKKVKFTNIFNCYGGTEMGNWVFCHKCSVSDLTKYKEENMVPIGKPFSSVVAKIDKKELVVSGPMISDGYTEKKFNIKKFIFNKNNTFRTGDKVKKIGTTFLCKGRLDNMVKISGYRIEVPDVEANFRKLSYIKDVIVFEKKRKNYNNYLVAVLSTISILKKELQIRKDLTKYLSRYMIPRKIHIVKNLQKNSNGKLDRSGISKRYS